MITKIVSNVKNKMDNQINRFYNGDKNMKLAIIKEFDSPIFVFRVFNRKSFYRHFLRLSEIKEHRNFKHRVFSLEEYFSEYIQEFHGNPANDIRGFNLTEENFKLFHEIYYDFFEKENVQIRPEEDKVFRYFEKLGFIKRKGAELTINKKFSLLVINCTRNTENVLIKKDVIDNEQKSIFLHEMSHAFYHVMPQYRKLINTCFGALSPKFKRKVIRELKEANYDKVSHIDEFGAYAADKTYFSDECFSKKTNSEDVKTLLHITRAFSQIVDIHQVWNNVKRLEEDFV